MAPWRSATTSLPLTGEPGGVEDHNRAVRRWVRRFDREVLGPLRVAHDLQGAVLTLE